MRWKYAVAIALIFSVIVPASAGWFSGTDSSIKEAALPVNRLRLTPRFRDTMEPLIYHVVGPDGSISAVFPEENMTVPLENRPLIATTRALLMTGDSKIIKIKPAAEGGPIKVIVECQNGWENESSWLSMAIAEAQEQMLCTPGQRLDTRARRALRETRRAERKQLGLSSDDPGPFPPFVALPAESLPRVGNDGFIYLGCPQTTMRIVIVTPISNLLPGDAHSVTLGVFVDRNRLWEETAATFMLARPDTFMVPNPALSQPRTEATPSASPLAQEPAPVAPQPPTITTTATASATATITTPQAAASCPPAIQSFVYGVLRLPHECDWRQPRSYVSGYDGWKQNGGRTTYFCCFLVKEDDSLLTKGAAYITLDGKPYGRPEHPSDYIVLDEGGREGIVYGFAPPHCTVRVQFPYNGQTVNIQFNTGEDGSTAYAPCFLKQGDN